MLPPQGEFVALFSSWDLLYKNVVMITQAQGYRLSKRRTTAFPDGKPMRVDLVCDHGGSKYKCIATQRRGHTRKTDCPWKAHASYMKTLGGQWKFVVTNGSHNHPPRDLNAKKPAKAPKPAPILRTGIQPVGMARAATDPTAQGFMNAVQLASGQAVEHLGSSNNAGGSGESSTSPGISSGSRSGGGGAGGGSGDSGGVDQRVLDILTRMEGKLNKIEHFDQRLERIENFEVRLQGIEERLAILEKEWE